MKMHRLLVITAFALGSAFALTFLAQEVRMSAPITGNTLAPAGKIPAAQRALHPNYPYSIIPGGAYSPAELRIVNQNDSLVRAHYADFNVSAARLVMLTEDRYQYVSFKLNNHIFWTHKKLRIPKGEILLTDGHSFARTRCGNRLSSLPQLNTTALKFPEYLLTMPAFRPELLSQLPPAPTPAMGELAQQFPNLPVEMTELTPALPVGTPGTMNVPESWPPAQVYTPIVPMAPGYAPTPTPTTPTTPTTPPNTPPVIPPTTPVPVAPIPEPGTAYLFGIGLCAALCVFARKARNESK